MYGIESSVWHQIGQACERFQKAGGLPFSQLLAPEVVRQALAETGSAFRDRIFNPLTTLWMFLSQVLCADGTCRQAVARLLAWRVAGGLDPCSADSSSYCQARLRLPLSAIQWLVRRTAGQLDEHAESEWLWKGRAVKVVDGTTVTMPDTPSNQAAFPQPSRQRREWAFRSHGWW